MWGLNSLANLDENKLKIARVGGIRAIVRVMRLFEQDREIQLEGTEALLNLSQLEGSDAIHDRIISCGSVVAVVRAMQVHKRNADLQLNACWVLGNLASHDDFPTAGDNNAIACIVEAMRTHGDHLVSREACEALAHLAVSSPINADRVIDAGGVATLAVALLRHPLDDEVQLHACQALLDLCDHDLSCLALLIEAGGIDAIASTYVRFAEPVSGGRKTGGNYDSAIEHAAGALGKKQDETRGGSRGGFASP